MCVCVCTYLCACVYIFSLIFVGKIFFFKKWRNQAYMMLLVPRGTSESAVFNGSPWSWLVHRCVCFGQYIYMSFNGACVPLVPIIVPLPPTPYLPHFTHRYTTHQGPKGIWVLWTSIYYAYLRTEIWWVFPIPFPFRLHCISPEVLHRQWST